jgi:hypothetical protein
VNQVALAVLVAAAVGDLWLVRALQPKGVSAGILLALWLIIPRAASAAWLSVARRSARQSTVAGVVTTLVAAGATSLLIDAIYVHPDAQGAIAVVLMPIYEMAALVVLAPITAWLAARWPAGR